MVMWTIRLRLKILYEWFICSWRGHDKSQFYPFHVTDSSDHFCRRCMKIKRSWRQEIDHLSEGRRRIWNVYLDWGGNETERKLVGSNVKGDNLMTGELADG